MESEEDKKLKRCEIIADRIVEDFINIYENPDYSKKTSYLYEWGSYDMIWRKNKHKSKLRFCQEEIDLLTEGYFYTGSLQNLIDNKLKLKYPHLLHDQGILQTFIYDQEGICIEQRTNNEDILRSESEIMFIRPTKPF